MSNPTWSDLVQHCTDHIYLHISIASSFQRDGSSLLEFSLFANEQAVSSESLHPCGVLLMSESRARKFYLPASEDTVDNIMRLQRDMAIACLFRSTAPRSLTVDTQRVGCLEWRLERDGVLGTLQYVCSATTMTSCEGKSTFSCAALLNANMPPLNSLLPTHKVDESTTPLLLLVCLNGVLQRVGPQDRLLHEVLTGAVASWSAYSPYSTDASASTQGSGNDVFARISDNGPTALTPTTDVHIFAAFLNVSSPQLANVTFVLNVETRTEEIVRASICSNDADLIKLCCREAGLRLCANHIDIFGRALRAKHTTEPGSVRRMAMIQCIADSIASIVAMSSNSDFKQNIVRMLRPTESNVDVPHGDQLSSASLRFLIEQRCN